MVADLRFLPWLRAPHRARDLADRAGRDPTSITRALHRLEARGLVHTWREGKDLVASRTGLVADMAAQLYEASPNLPWDDLLSDAHLDLVAFFSSPADEPLRAPLPPEVGEQRSRPYVPKTVQAAAEWTGLSVPHAHRLVRDLASPVILVKESDGYALAPEHVLLREVAKLLAVERVLRRIRAAAPRAYPLWQLGPVAIYQAPAAAPPGAPPGGISLLRDHGFPLIEATPTFLHAPWTPGPSDAILQTYLQAPTRTLHVALACLLYHTTRPDDFLRRARSYGVPHAARIIQGYAENPGRQTGGGLPSRADYEEFARQYGVTL